MARLGLGSKDYGTKAPDSIHLEMTVDLYLDPAQVGYDTPFDELVDLVVSRIRQIDFVTDAD